MKIKRPLDVRLIALCTTCLLIPAMACPSECICKWKNGKRHVECLEKGLNQIPGPLDPETQVLDFAGNDLQLLQKEAFQKLGLFDLQKIHLPRCKLHKIDNYSFKGLANLVELDLSDNYITVIPSTNFIFFPSLMKLSMNNNPVTIIKSHSFQHLMYLNTLELSDCKIETIENDAFSGLHHLERLRLDGNKLTTINGDNMFPDTLRGIDLQNNRWNCDCQIRSLNDWLLKFNKPHTVEPVCFTPDRLKKRKITSLTGSEMACSPKIIPATIFLETNEGNNVTFECYVKAIPEAEISWWFQGQIIQNDTNNFELRTSYSIVGSVEKKSELYIFNVDRHDNGTYVCIADNIAGRMQANYTLKIIIKEEPVIVVVTFPRKHLVVIVTGVFLIIVLVIAIVAVSLLKFKTDTRSRKKKDTGKECALRNQNGSSLANNDSSTFGTLQRKTNGSIMTNAQTHHIVHYTIQESTEDSFRSGSIKNFVERNPDIINDAESVKTTILHDSSVLSVYNNQNGNIDRVDGESYIPSMMPRQVTWQDQQPAVSSHPVQGNIPPYSMYQHSADIHLNPGCFLDNEGYPYDYGLPKLQCRSAPVHSNYATVGAGYQTLPHNRPKAQKLTCKFAKDTEFNSQTPCLNYVSGNFRHTLEGYPIIQNRPTPFGGNGNMYINQQETIPAPGGFSNEPVVMCCGVAQVEPCSSWNNPKGSCAVMVPMDISENGPSKCYHVETRCVDTQTTDLRNHNENTENLKPALKSTNTKYELEVCTESPDEGYVGEAVDNSDT